MAAAPPFPSLTSKWHNDTYPSIDPTKADLSHKGRAVVLTGAGSGIGRATAIAYAQAGAKYIALLGRTEATLRETETLVRDANAEIKIDVCVVSVTNEAGVKGVAEKVGRWDVLVLNAGYLSSPTKIADVGVEEFWKGFETNVKSIVIATQAFLPAARPGAAILAVGAAGCILPPMFGGLSSYMSSKAAQVKLVEYLAAENPEVLICTVHPGVVETEIKKKAELESLSTDTAELPAHFLVWMSHDVGKTGFLRGRFMWANWDVEEILGKKAEIEKSNALCTLGLVGWPFDKSG